MLSADMLLTAAFAGVSTAQVHKPVTVVHEDGPISQGILSEGITYHNTAPGADGIFDGMSGQAVQSQPATTEKPVTQTENASGQSPATSADNEAGTTQNSSTAVQTTSTVETVTGSTASTESSAANSTISATSTSVSPNTMTQQLTTTLTAANGPPASTATSQVSSYQSVSSNTSSTSTSNGGGGTVVNSNASPNTPAGLFSTIEADIAAIESGNTYSTPPTTVTLGGVMTIEGLQLTFVTSGTTVTSVTISAASATLNLGGAVTSTITGLSGSYNPTAKEFSLTLGSGGAGSINIAFSSFVNITAASANLTYDAGSTTTVILSDTTTQPVSLLTVGMSDVTIVAGLNGSTGPGVELDSANLALALMSTSGGTTYYGVAASATALKGVGLPNDLQVGAGDLNIQINSTNDGSTNVVNFDASFPNPGGNGLAVPGSSFVLDYTQSLVQVSGTMNLTVGDYLQIGGGFSFTQVPGEVDVSVGTLANPLTFTVGPSSNPIFSASGSLSMTFTSTTFTINNAVLTINTSIQIASVLEVQGPSIGLSNLSIDLATGDLSGVVDASGVHHPVLTLAAVSATLFPGGSAITGSVSPTTPGDNGFQGTVDLQTGAFSITLEQFHLAVGSVFTADATGVLLTYDPNGSADQQLVQIGSGTLDFKFGSSDITGSLTDLTIYGNGFYFGSVTIAYAGSIGLGSILTVDSPSLTLTDFGVAYQNGTATVLAGSLTLAAGSATLNVGTAFSASATDLSITISLDPATLGQTTATASTVTMQISSILSIQATDITINSNPANGDPYLSVGSATVTLGLSSLTLSGTTSSFSIINANNTPELQPGPNFTVTLSATPGQLGLPSWLGFQIQKLEIQWQNNDFTDNPSQFRLILSASINSIQGLPGGVTVSGEITDAVIDTGKLENGQFPITSIGSVGGSVSGTLFGMEVNAGFVLGIVNFNPQNQIVNGDGTVVKLTHNPDGSVTETPVPGGNTTIADSVLYVGVAGGAEIPGVGGVQIYIGFSSLGPLTVYLSAEFPLILDPDTGLAIGGFSGGVIFDYTIPTPSQPMDLANLSLSPANITISQWQQQLRDQTVVQYTASGGGTNLTAAYTQPFVIEAGVTLYDAYAGPEAFTITGDIAIQIDPAQPNSTHIFVTGTATFGGGVNFNAFLYLGITVSGGTSSATVMFLVQEPAPPATVETFGGALTFGFTDASGNPITPTAPSSTTYSEWIALGTTYDSTGASSISDLPAGTYVWTPAANDTSLTVGGTTYLASDAVNGQVTFTTNATATATFAGTPNTAITGTLGSVLAQGASLPPGAQYTVTTFAQPAAVGGFYISLDGFASFSAFGALTATVTGSVTLTVTGSFAKIDLSGTLNVSDLGNLATASGELVVDYSNVASGGNLEIYGALKLQTGSGFAKLEGVGLYADGAATFVLNTTDSPQTVYLPDPTAPHDPTKATAFVINDFEAFEVTIAGTTTGTGTSTDYASLTYKIGGNTALTMQGYLDLRISVSNGLEIFADIHSLEVGPSATPFITFQGYGLFVINAQGFAAEMTLSLSSGTTASFGSGLTLDASFTLVMNTTSTDVTYTIPNTLPGLTVPDGSGGTTTIYSLTIPRGPPQGVQQPDGSFASIGATGPYIVITGSGTLGISVGSLSALSFQGFFRFELSASASGPVVSLYINMTGDVLSYTNIEVTGALQINTAGVVALLNMGVASGTTTDFGSGVIVSASFQLAINSTSSPVGSIGGVTLTDSSGNPISIDANTYELFGSGTLALGVGGTGFTITGSIFTSVSGTATTITVSGKLTATVAGTTFLTMQADGVLVADTGGANPGIAGALTLTLTNGSPLSGSGFDFNGTFDLRLNTTLVQQTVSVGGGTVTIAAGLNGSNNNPAPYVEVHAYGTLAFGTMTNGFLLDGDFYLAISTNGLAVSATATLSVEVGGVSLLSINTQAAMMINSSGLAATLTVSTHLTDGSYYYLGGTFQLMVNTTGTDVVIGGVTVPGAPFSGAAAGPYFELAITGAKLMLGTTNPSATTALYLDGDFRLTIGSTGLAITATATLNLEIAGTNFFSFTADGALLISQAGIAAQIDLTAGTNQPGDSNFSFNVTLSLEVNTTGSSVTSINSQNVNLPAQDAFGNSYYFDLAGRGSLTLAGIIKISGSFAFATGSNGVQMEVNGTVNILGVLFTINVDAGIYADGIEIYAVLGLSGGGSSASFLNGLITVKAQFVFEINTSSTQTHYGVPVNTAFALHIHNTSGSGNAQVYIFGFELTGQFDITIHNGGFQASGNLNFNFFGFGNVSIGFLFDSSGNYYFVGHLYVRLGSASFNIHGQLTVVFASTSEFGKTVNGVTISSNFELHVSGGATAFHINFASISADVKISGTSVDISVRVKVLFVHKTIHIHLGSLANVPTPPLPDLGYVSGGVLYLNITQSGEDYEITENGDGTITVYDPGISNQTVTYTASSIYIDLTHYNDSTVNITDNGANLPVTIISGGGTNSFFLGGGTSTVTGTTGNDTVVGGTGNVTFNAGSGTSVFIGGGTGSTHNVVNDPGNVTISESGYSSYSLVGTSAGSATLTYDGNTTALNGTSITVSLTGVASGTQAFAVTNYSGAVTLNANGNSAANVTTTITLDTGDLSLTGNTVTESNGTTGTITLENVDSSNASYAYGPLTLIGGSGANTFLVNGWTGGVLMLDGGENGDTYVINFQNTGSFTAYVNDSGVSGTDILNVNGSTSGDTINVSASAVALGSQTVNYSGIENLTVYTKVSGEIVNVTGTSAATTINTGSYADTINVGTHATSGNAGGTLNDITSTLTVIGSTSSDTLNLDDTGDAMTNAGNLSYNSGTNVSTLTGLFGTGGLLKYTNIKTVNLNLGSGTNRLTVQSSSTGTMNITGGGGNDTFNIQGMNGTMTVNTGAGINTVNLGSTAPLANGLLKNIKGALAINGGGTTTVNADDTGDTVAASGTLTGSTLNGLGMGVSGVTYSGLAALNISLGSGGNTFTISSTNPATVTTLNSGSGNDTINIQSTGGVTNVNTGSGTNTINVGSLAPVTGGLVNGIQGALTVVGSGSDTMNVDDTGDVTG